MDLGRQWKTALSAQVPASHTGDSDGAPERRFWHGLTLGAVGIWNVNQHINHSELSLLSLSACVYVCICFCLYITTFQINKSYRHRKEMVGLNSSEMQR